MNDMFFKQKYCSRCGFRLFARTCSMFSDEPICPECKELEKKHPKYAVAREVEHKELLKGNCNYKGVGSPFEVSFTDAPYPEHCDLMPILTFVSLCRSESITSDDGVGYYCIDRAQSNISVDCDELKEGNVDNKRPWTHVAWFNN